MAGQASNGHAVEAAYRLAELTSAPVTLVMDESAMMSRSMSQPRLRDEEPA
jgi:succinoglycan biosynthesis transport protein ExoP